MRNPSQRLADLRAQRAANLTGERRLLELPEREGPDVLRAGMAEILDYAERRTRARLSELPDGTYEAEDVLEDDAAGPERDIRLHVSARIEGDRLTLDFTGTDAQVEGNLNCPLSGDQVGRVLRGAGGDRPRRAPVRGRLPARSR